MVAGGWAEGVGCSGLGSGRPLRDLGAQGGFSLAGSLAAALGAPVLWLLQGVTVCGSAGESSMAPRGLDLLRLRCDSRPWAPLVCFVASLPSPGVGAGPGFGSAAPTVPGWFLRRRARTQFLVGCVDLGGLEGVASWGRVWGSVGVCGWMLVVACALLVVCAWRECRGFCRAPLPCRAGGVVCMCACLHVFLLARVSMCPGVWCTLCAFGFANA